MSELPVGWAETRLEDCVDILDALRQPINADERKNRIEGKSAAELFPYYGATGQVGLIDEFIFDEELVALGEDGAPFLDAKKSKAYLIHGKSWVNNHAHVLRGRAEVLDNRILCYFLNQFNYRGHVNGGTRLKLTQANMRKIPLRMPPFNEQKRIARELDELLAKIDALKARVDAIPVMFKRLRQSIISAAVSGRLFGNMEPGAWTNTKFGEVITSISNGIGGTQNKSRRGIPVSRIETIANEKIDFDRIGYVESATTEDASRFKLKSGDILFSHINSPNHLGKTAIFRDGNLFHGINLLRITVNRDLILPEFFVYVCRNHRSLGNFSRRAQHAVNQSSLNQKKISDFDISFPSLERQVEIISRAEHFFALVEQLEAKVSAAQQRINTLTQSLLAKAFRGELVPQDPNDEPASVLLERIRAQQAAAPKPKRGRKSRATT